MSKVNRIASCSSFNMQTEAMAWTCVNSSGNILLGIVTYTPFVSSQEKQMSNEQQIKINGYGTALESQVSISETELTK